jgi:hypothetical protein
MKVKPATLGITLAAGLTLAFGFSASAPGQGTAAKTSAASKKAAPAASKSSQAMATPQSGEQAKPKPKKRKAHAMHGVPKGVPACIDHLAKMAAKDPLVDYAGHPEEIVNNGLLWNSPKSKCYLEDAGLRLKVLDLAGAWRAKDAAKVRSLLDELKSSASQ